MLVRVIKDFYLRGNSRSYRKGELLSVRRCLVTGSYFLIRKLENNKYVEDYVDKNCIELIP